jgi:2-polyprenyl-6-methoxyphenol hydroxylase-like FAD-dependent oxidoreductase
MRIVVVGGSIGGLAAAVALRQAGADVRVLEGRASMADEGTGLALRLEGIEALRTLGVSISGAPIRGWRYAAVVEGRVSVRLEWSAPLVAYTYGGLRAALLARAAGIEIRTGARVTAIGPDGPAIRVRGDGFELEADLVVAADGVDSLARRTLFPDLCPEPMGIAMWRGFASEDEARAVFGADVLEGFLDVNTQLFASSARGWWLGFLVPERTAGAGRRFVWICYLRAEDAASTAYALSSAPTSRHRSRRSRKPDW